MLESAARFLVPSDLLCIANFDGYFVKVSESWETVLGFTTDELMAQPFIEFVHPDDRESTIAESAALFRNKPVTIDFVNRYRCKDGTYRWLSWSTNSDFAAKKLFAVARDVTAQKLLEEELKKASRLKDEFLATMSHELRTPLNGILMTAEAAQAGIFGPVPDSVAEAIHSIEVSGRHLLSLINDILDISKVEAGKTELEIESVRVEPLCQECLQVVRTRAKKKNLRISLVMDAETPTIPADRRRLKQILLNLLSNAVKFTPNGGTVGLEVETDMKERTMRFIVWDTGIGIPTTDLARIFQPFTQLNSDLARSEEGTGLGLALVSRLAELHGGSVSVTSEPSRGSSFTVALPLAPPNPDTTALTGEGNFNGSVLVVEDSVATATVLSRYLAEFELRSFVQVLGESAVEHAVDLQPDIIILDLVLPDKSGWQIIEELKANPKTAHIPVVIVSVLDEKQRGIDAGAHEYLVKPVSRADFKAAIERVLNGERDSAGGGRALLLTPVPIDAAKVLPPEPSSASNVTPPATPGPAPPPTGKLVLLAEDNINVVNLMQTILRTTNHRVEVAHDGIEAVTMTRELQPDLILMDVQMPRKDGLAAIVEIRADPAFADLPIVALTALAMAGDAERCLAAGATEYLSKPVGVKTLLATVQKYLATHG